MASMTANGVGDVTLAGGLLSSPVWASWLAEINATLTTITLLIGILIGLVRLWVLPGKTHVKRQRPRMAKDHETNARTALRVAMA
jgi:hypothetical protein